MGFCSVSCRLKHPHKVTSGPGPSRSRSNTRAGARTAAAVALIAAVQLQPAAQNKSIPIHSTHITAHTNLNQRHAGQRRPTDSPPPFRATPAYPAMAPAAAAAKKKAPTDAAGDRELLVRAQAELLSLRRVAECKAHEAVEARQQERSWRQRAETADAVLEQARQDLADIKADMGRQHVMLQEQLSQQVARLERQLAEVQGQLATEQQAAAAKDAQLQQLLVDKGQQEATWQAQSDALHARFDTMLRAALAQMHSGLEETLSQACCPATTAAHTGQQQQQS